MLPPPPSSAGAEPASPAGMGHGAHEPYYAGSTGYHHGRTASSASTASITSSTSHNHHGRKHHNAVGTTTPRRESSSTLTAAGLASPGSPLGPRLQPAAGGGGGGGAPTLRPSSSVPRFGWLQQHHQQHQYPGAAAAEDGRPRVRSMQPALGGTEPVGNDDGGGVQNSNARPQKSAAATVPGHEPTQHALGRDESLRDETDSGPRAETHTQPHEGLRAGVKWWNDPWMPTSKHPHQHNHSRPDNLPHNTDAQHHHQSPHNLPQHHHQPLQQQHQQQLGQPTGGMYRSSTGGSPRREMESDPKLNGVSVRPLPSPAPSSPGLPGSVGYQSGDDPTGLSTSSAHFRGGNPSTHVSTHATWCRSAVDYPPVTTMTPPPPTGALAQIRPEARPPEDRRASSSASLWSISATSAGVVVGARGPGQPEGLIGNDRNPNHHYHHQYSVHEHSPRPDAEDGWNSSRPGSFTDRRPPPVSPATLPSHPVLATGSVSGNTRQIKGFATITPNNISSLCNSPTTITYEAALPPRAPSTGASWKRLPSFVGFPASTSPSPSSPAHQPRPPPPPQPMDQDPSTSPGTSATEYNLVESSLPPMMSRASLASSTGSASDSTSSTVTTTSTDTTITTNPIHQRKARAGSLIGAGSSTPGENGGKKEYRCTKKEGCNMLFSCNSLRKKHEMKHTKPFTCLHRTCPKYTVGFTTSNDLRRHMKALHGNVHRHLSSPSATIKAHNNTTYSYSIRSSSSVSLSPAAASPVSTLKLLADHERGTPPPLQPLLISQDSNAVVVVEVGGWRCIYCPDGSGSFVSGMGGPTGGGGGGKGFFSTRKDNFRNHVKRIHSGLRRDGESMDDFFKRSEVECRVDSPVLQPSTLTLTPGQLPQAPPPLESEKESKPISVMEDTEMHMGNTVDGGSASADHQQGFSHHLQAAHRYSRSAENATGPNSGLWSQRLPSISASPRLPSGGSAPVSNITTAGLGRSNSNVPAEVSPRNTTSASQWRARTASLAADTSPRMMHLASTGSQQSAMAERNNSPRAIFAERRTSSWTAVNQHQHSVSNWGAAGSGGPRTATAGPVGDRRESAHTEHHRNAPTADFSAVANHIRSNSYSSYGESPASKLRLSSPPRGVGGGPLDTAQAYAHSPETGAIENFNRSAPRTHANNAEHEDVHKELRQLEDEERQAEKLLEEIREKKKNLLGRLHQRAFHQPQYYDGGNGNQPDIEMVDRPENYAPGNYPHRQPQLQELQKEKPKPDRSIGPTRDGSLSLVLNSDDDQDDRSSTYRTQPNHRHSYSSEQITSSAADSYNSSSVPSSSYYSPGSTDHPPPAATMPSSRGGPPPPFLSHTPPPRNLHPGWDSSAASHGAFSPIRSSNQNDHQSNHTQLQEQGTSALPVSTQRVRQSQSQQTARGAKELSTPALPQQNTSRSDTGNREYKEFCPQCSSSFRLPCQLRKHMKRHSKPFGCTHDNCSKVFGAKNDWKRHENSQHHQLECWKCDITVPNTVGNGSTSDQPSICGKCCFRKADFVKHLKDVHGNRDGWVVDPNSTTTTSTTSQASLDATLSTPPPPTLPTQATATGRDAQQILRDCHIPKFHGGAFWCGFCMRVIKLDGRVGIEGWDKRFDHIADHFEKEGLRVKDRWLRLENPAEQHKTGERKPGASGLQGRSAGSGRGKAKGTLKPRRKLSSDLAMSSDLEDYEDPEEDDEPDGDDDLEDDDDEEMADSTSDRIQPQSAPPTKLQAGKKYWDCCKCNYGPFINEIYESCTNCQHHEKCESCRERWGAPIKQSDHAPGASREPERKLSIQHQQQHKNLQ